MSSFVGKHASGGVAANQPSLPEPSFAERARTLMYLGRIGSLSTQSRKQPGFPFGSVMPYASDEHGRPIFLISTMAMHTQNLKADPRASLLVTQADGDGEGCIEGNAARKRPTRGAGGDRGGAQALPRELPEQQALGGLRRFLFIRHGSSGRLLRGRVRRDGLDLCFRLSTGAT
jgi:hypothetical protein